ncbi:hypothetical protein EVAR_6377_1 [Eumeta japonica]|uniref:Uncharacterized protein n=1 Tax=Eumeta variegata TaxID=151549 RepID=A0A4C1TFK6_EUMVA|nr:hypothetical protein EVAR_6377_1 [Eumeta japonica]
MQTSCNCDAGRVAITVHIHGPSSAVPNGTRRQGTGDRTSEMKIKKKRIRGPEGKYRVAAPELMQDTFMSDSEDEGGNC